MRIRTSVLVGFMVLAIFCGCGLPAWAQSKQWQWTSDALPSQTFKSRFETEAALHALGGKYAAATEVTSEQITDTQIIVGYGAPDQDLVKGTWSYCMDVGCPQPTHDAAVSAWTTVNAVAGCPSPSVADTPYYSWYPVGWQPYQNYPGSNVTVQEQLQMYYANYRVPGCDVYYGPASMMRSRTVDCPAYLSWNTTRQVCALKDVAHIVGSVLTACPAKEGDPCDARTGDEIQTENDVDLGWIRVDRTYHSLIPQLGNSLGVGWTSSLYKHLAVDQASATPDGIVDAEGYENPVHVVATVGNDKYYEPSTGTGQVIHFGGAGMVAQNPDGSQDYFDRSSGMWLQTDRTDGSSLVAIYDSAGRLGGIRHSSGRVLDLIYNSASRRLDRIDADGVVLVQYHYDGAGNLASVSKTGQPDRIYRYEDPRLPNHLTGIMDESGNRFATISYDDFGRAIATEHAGGTEHVSLVYQTDGTTTATRATGEVVNYTFTPGDLFRMSQSTSGTAGTASTQRLDYATDFRRKVSQRIDRAGHVTRYTYTQTDSLRSERRIEAEGTSDARVIETDTALPSNRVQERRTYNASSVLVAKSNWTYNSRGQALTQTQTDPATGTARTSTTTYCEQADVTAGTCPIVGLVTKIDGPRTDVSDISTYTYYPSDDATCASAPTTCPHRKGDVWKITNALGQVTETLGYDGAGRPLSLKDANGVITDLAYLPRGWLSTRKVRGPDNTTQTDDAITTMDYWPTGLVKQVTQPDGAFTTYTYDAAHRLTDVADNAGNTIHYALDSAGNRTGEATKDSSGALKRTLSRIYNQLGQLQTQTDAYQHATGFTYDAVGNSDLTTDALSRVTNNDYDPLNRLSRTLQDTAGINAQTAFQYDALDNLTKVTDPKRLDTNYTYNALGDLLQLSSPDTGATSYTYDSAGNRKTQTDARNTTATYSYDALNRLIGITYPTVSLNVTYAYDASQAACIAGETFGNGRLTKLIDASGSTQYCYDRFGNMVRKAQLTNGKTLSVLYAYTLAGRLQSVTYPDGKIVDYVRDGQGRVVEMGVTSAGCRQVLLNSATYAPFGPATGWTFGGSGTSVCVGSQPLPTRSFVRTFNQNYQPNTIQDPGPGGLSLGYSFDAVGNLAILRNAQQTDPPQARYGYDGLNRLGDVMDGPTATVLEHYDYDATGNRTSLTAAGATTAYTYPTNNHRLAAVGSMPRSYDLAGNTTQIGGTVRQFVYNDANRMSQVLAGSTPTMNYLYNGKGEQVRKSIGTTNTYSVYDEAGHWLGDYDTNGAAVQQMVWMDDLPVGLMASNGINYVEADAMGSPRAVIDPNRGVAIWNWDLKGEAFGNTVPNQNPDGDATQFVFNMRYPGQRYDAASGLNQNGFRDYEATTGRYAESDPIGLMAGPSTYSYVGADPLHKTDPLGLAAVYGGGTFVFPIVGPLDGAVGETTLVCTDNCNKPKKYVYKKFCIGLGSGWGASLLVGRVNGMSGMSCKDPSRYAGYFLEFSGGVGVVGGGIDVGLTENSNRLPNGVSPVNEFGVGLSSSGGSVLLCRYVLVRSE